MARTSPYKARHGEQVRLRIARRRLHLMMRRCNPLVAVAMFMTVGGWSLMWAQALSLLDLVPMWVTVAAFGLGLALIPLGSLTGRKPAASRELEPPSTTLDDEVTPLRAGLG